MPMKSKTKGVEAKFSFMKPKSVGIFGSFNADCVLKSIGEIDLFVEIPKVIIYPLIFICETCQTCLINISPLLAMFSERRLP